MTRRVVVAALLALLVLAYLATGWIAVAPGEAVVVRRFGRLLPRPWTSGLHWVWPLGLDRVARVRTDEVRRLTVGLVGTPGAADAPDAGEYLTGDLNLLRAEAAVQYRVSDPAAFVTRASAVGPLLERLVEASLSRALARHGIDAALRAERAAIAREVESDLGAVLQREPLGVSVLGVSLTDARPPQEVAPDFAAAQAARSEHDRRINEARTYAATTLPAARAGAQAKTDQARAYAERTLALTRSRVGRFEALLAEANRSRPLTVRRLYLDTLRELLPKVRRKIVLAPDEAVDLSLYGVEQQ
ncbi:MAG: protease modulator HflK [Isosphaeraceae bacterium]|nr:protease modulator HflK [Isosphaeraceae bacterium]